MPRTAERPKSLLDYAALVEAEGRYGFVEEGSSYDRLEWALRIGDAFGEAQAVIILLMKNAIAELEADKAALEARIADLEIEIGRRRQPLEQRSVIDIAQFVARETGLRIAAIRNDGKSQTATMARQVVVWVAREITGFSFPRIARALGNRDHTTIIHHFRRAEMRRNVDPAFRELCDRTRLAFIPRDHPHASPEEPPL